MQLRQHRDPGPRRLRLRRRPPGRALLPRRARDDPVRGHLADPEADHRPRADRRQRAGAGLTATGVDSSSPRSIGVVGAGTMGAGIAQLACLAGARTLLHDPDPRRARARRSSRSRAEPRARRRARALEQPRRPRRPPRGCEPAPRSRTLAPCELVIEAAPERARAQARAVRAPVARSSPRTACWRRNTSSLLVTAIAAGGARPERVVGMHFFNPAPLMRAARGRRRRASPRARRWRWPAPPARRWAST